MRAGSTVTQTITPMTTPLHITMPRSFPRANVIKQRARNPAIVVMELEDTDLNVLAIACAMARLSSPSNRFLFAE